MTDAEETIKQVQRDMEEQKRLHLRKFIEERQLTPREAAFLQGTARLVLDPKDAELIIRETVEFTMTETEKAATLAKQYTQDRRRHMEAWLETNHPKPEPYGPFEPSIGGLAKKLLG